MIVVVAEGHDQALVVDGDGFRNYEPGCGRDQAVEILHPAGACPEEGAHGVSGGGKADDVPVRIDGASAVVLPTRQGPEILDCAPRGPEYGATAVRAARPADDVASVVDMHRFALAVARQHAEIFHAGG